MEYWLGHTPGRAPDDVSVRAGTTPSRVGNLFLQETSPSAVSAALQGRDRLWVVGYPGSTWRPTANTGGDVAESAERQWTTMRRVGFGEVQLILLQRT